MRGEAERLAEAIAPGLSNRTMDGRWLSIMCWALEQAYAAWWVLGRTDNDGHDVSSTSTGEVYSWLRPLELLWVARTIAKTDDGGRARQLPGVRAVRHWLDGEVSHKPFGFERSSYHRYRFTGVYGAYRVALRSLPGLTTGGDGWRLGSIGREFAGIVHGEARCSRTHHRRKGVRPEPERYWQRGFEWRRGGAEFLPTVLAHPRRLPGPERELLRRVLFSSTEGSDLERTHAKRRRSVVEAAARSAAATQHGLFADVARTLGNGQPHEEIALLSPFCELADAGVAAMNACWTAVGEWDGAGFARASDVLDRGEVADALSVLVAAANRWQRDSTKGGRPIAVADALAANVLAARGRRDRQFQALERHHNQFGGGLKWLALEGGAIKPLAPIRGGDASEYRFRLAALCRLGVQAGIIHTMPAALRVSDEFEAEGGEEGTT